MATDVSSGTESDGAAVCAKAANGIAGYQIILEPGAEYHSLLHTVQLIRYFRDRYSQFAFREDFFDRLGDPVIEEYLKGTITFDIVQEHVKLEEQKWIRKAKRYMLYDEQPFRIK